MVISPMARNFVVLSSGWTFKQTDTETWLPVARVPTNVHLDLMDNGIIKDPFLGFNELDCQWVATKAWTYKVTLPSVVPPNPGQKLVLAMDGLDTYATVKVDGSVVLLSDNMSVIHRVDVTDKLAKKGRHVLEIDFASAAIEALKVKHAHPEHVWVGFMGVTSRQASRKAQHHWGWDWGPVLTTCGPWREVRLETYQTRIADIRVDYQVAPGLKAVSGTLHVIIEGHSRGIVSVTALTLTTRQVVLDERIEILSDNTACLGFLIKDPDLWHPHGYGEQAMYTIDVAVVCDGIVLDSSHRRIGFRKAELIQQPDHLGKSFYFRINDVDVFCGGSNWIPADSFPPRITENRYRRWLQLMVDGNQIMTRIWGGGIWEHDCFYDTCDELGILVWQDFMFACGNYPTFPEMLDSIERECTDQVKRLRHHPSIIVYAGNNEDYQVMEQNGLTYDYNDKLPENWLKTNFPARYIYEKLLPSILSLHQPSIPYHPGSPWSDSGLPTTDPTQGDTHIWTVWHGTQEKYQSYPSLGGRFNSEFGMQAFPCLATIETFVTDARELHPQSRMLEFHDKAAGHAARLAAYVADNFRMEAGLEGWVFLTQLCQAEALAWAYAGWRRRWGGRECGGALVWQVNDCWPGTSWAVADYYLRRKPGFYAMMRALAPVAVAVRREWEDWGRYQARPNGKSRWECWVVSNKTRMVRGRVEVRFLSIESGDEVEKRLVRDVEIEPNGTTAVAEGVVDNTATKPHVIAAKLWVDGDVVGRVADFPQPLKYDDYSGRGLVVKQTGDRIVISAEKPTKCLVFEERDGVQLSDNAVDVMPGDELVIPAKGLQQGEPPLKWRYYSM